MNIDAVFSGGGVKAFAFIGALEAMEEKGLVIKRAAGTSAGAILASMVLAGYKVSEMKQLLEEVDLSSFTDAPLYVRRFRLAKWLQLFFKMGIYKGDRFEKWLEAVLAKKGLKTFGDLPAGSLRMIASDLSLGKLIVIPDDLKKVYDVDPNTFPVAKAVRMSAGFPFFFMPEKLYGMLPEPSLMVDGGLLSNFPLWIFTSDKQQQKRPILGVKLSSSYIPELQRKRIRNAFDLCQAMLSAMKGAHDERYVSAWAEHNIISIPITDTNTMDLDISTANKEKLIGIGKESAVRYLTYWPGK